MTIHEGRFALQRMPVCIVRYVLIIALLPACLWKYIGIFATIPPVPYTYGSVAQLAQPKAIR